MIRSSFIAGLQALAAAQGEEIEGWKIRSEPMQWTPYNFRGVPQARESAIYTLPSYMNRGSENNLFVATGKGIEAWDVVPPGQSGFQPPSGVTEPHADDQMQLYADFGYKTIPFKRDEVRSAAVTTTVLQGPGSR